MNWNAAVEKLKQNKVVHRKGNLLHLQMVNEIYDNSPYHVQKIAVVEYFTMNHVKLSSEDCNATDWEVSKWHTEDLKIRMNYPRKMNRLISLWWKLKHRWNFVFKGYDGKKFYSRINYVTIKNDCILFNETIDSMGAGGDLDIAYK